MRTGRESVSLTSVRRVTRESADPRAARTLQKIINAVHDLAKAGVRSITVADVIGEAQIGKTSFYSHFCGISELALVVFERSFDSSEPGERKLPLTAEAIVAHYAENRGLYETVLAVPQNAKIMSTAISALAARLGTGGDDDDRANGRDHITAMIAASAIIGALNAWLRGEIPATEEQLAAGLRDLLLPKSGRAQA